MQYIINLFSNGAIHQRILLYNNLVIALAITNLLYSKVLKPTLLLVLKTQHSSFYWTPSTPKFIEALSGKQASYITVVVGYLCY